MNRRESFGNRHRGFTILEILVAVALFATALVAIFGAQFSAVASAGYARNISQATQLARCRMSELELLFIEEGFQEGSILERGDCCEVLDSISSETSFACEWKIETVVFPDFSESMAGDSQEDSGVQGLLEEQMGGAGLDGLTSGLASGDLAAMGMGMLGGMLPMITGLLEQAIRRVTVRVIWQEGRTEQDFELLQYVTHPTQGALGMMQEVGAGQRMLDRIMDSVGVPDDSRQGMRPGR